MVNDILADINKAGLNDGLDRTDLTGLTIEAASAAHALSTAASFARRMGRSLDEEVLLQAFDATVQVIGRIRTDLHLSL